VSDAQVAGWVLIAAAAASLIGATMPPLAIRSVWVLPLDQYLKVIREHELAWRAHSWAFATGTVLMAIGLWLFARASSSPFALAAAALYATVAPAWLGTLAFRLDITVWASRGEPPAVYEFIGRWSSSLYAIFMVGGYWAIALLGVALSDDGRVPIWTAQVVFVLGVVAAVWFGIGKPRIAGIRSLFDLPLLVQLIPLFVAIPLAAYG